MDISVLLRCWNLLRRRTDKPTLIPLQELRREGREMYRRRIVIFQHSCISPQPKKAKNTPASHFHPHPVITGRGISQTGEWVSCAGGSIPQCIHPMGKFSHKTVELHKDDCSSLFQHFQGRTKTKIIAGDQIFGNGSTLKFI